MNTNRGRLLVLLSLSLAFVFVACTSDDDTADETPSPAPVEQAAEATSTPEPTPEPLPSPTPTVEPTPEPSPSLTAEPAPEPSPTVEPVDADTGRVYTAEDLEALLLGPDDVPAQWDQIPSYGTPTENPPCEVEAPATSLTSAPFAQVDFMRDHADSIVGQIVIWLENEDDAISAMAWYAEAFACDKLEDGSGNSWQITEFEFPEFGDESFARQINLVSEDSPFFMQYGFVRRGQFLSFVAESDIEALDADQLTSLAQTAVDKLPE